MGQVKKIKIKCNKCKQYFYQSPRNHLTGQGCPKCCQSKGELSVKKWLKENNIIFEEQKRFDDCKDKRKLFLIFSFLKNNCEFYGYGHRIIYI